MKKRILATILMLGMAVCLMPATALAVSSNTDESTAAYEAYYDFLQGELDSVGATVTDQDTIAIVSKHYPTVSTNAWYNAEIKFAYLLDFDGNGIPELLFRKTVKGTGYASENVDGLYTYTNGNMILVTRDIPYESYETLRVTKGTDGKTYIADYDHGTYSGSGGTYERYSFYTIINGKWTIAEKMNRFFVPDFYIEHIVHSSTGKHYYFVGSDGTEVPPAGTSVSAQEYNARKQVFMGNGNDVIALQECTANVALNKISQYIPSYVSSYKTPSKWALDNVNEAISEGIVSESLQKKYTQPITRAEFCALIANFYEYVTGETITKTATFSDTSDLNVQKVAGLGIVKGVGNNKFDPDGLLTREQAAVMLVRLATALDLLLPKDSPTFSDNSNISSWAFEQVGQIQSAGIMGGTGNNKFSPQSSYTREQSIVTIMRMDNLRPTVTGLGFEETELEMPVGSSRTLEPIITAVNAAKKTFAWTSSNPQVATVDQASGKITAVSVGRSVITVTAVGGASTTCVINVVQPSGRFYTQLPVTIDCFKYRITTGEDSHTLAGTVTITDIEEVSEYYNQYISMFITALNVNGVILSRDSSVDILTRFPYIKYVVEDLNGNIIDSGRLTGDVKGDTFSLRLELRTKSQGTYIIRFLSDEL